MLGPVEVPRIGEGKVRMCSRLPGRALDAGVIPAPRRGAITPAHGHGYCSVVITSKSH